MSRCLTLLLLALPACADVDPASLAAPTDGTDSITKIINGRFTFERPEVGLLQWNGGSCTATLIRDNVVLTAAHCVGWSTNDGRGRPLGNFIIHSQQGQGTSYAFDAHISYGADFNRGGDPQSDVALLRLTQRVPANVAQPALVAPRRPNPGEQVILWGYGCANRDFTQDGNQGRKQKLPFQQGRTTNLCPGDSGGPTFLADGSVFQVNSAYDGAGTDLFGDVVGMRAKVDQQATAWSGNAGVAPEAEQPRGPALGCEGIYMCLQGCAGEVSCAQDCARRTGVEPRRRYDALVACSQANACQTSDCLGQNCQAQLDTCLDDGVDLPAPDRAAPGGDLSCLDILGCGQQCRGDADCFGNCLRQADPAEKPLYDAYAQCFRDNACRDGACARQHCGAEYDACAQVRRAPQPDAPPAGQAPNGPQPNDPPADGGPVQLDCKTVAQCVAGCGWNDQSCQQNCFFQGSQQAQIAYGAMAACGAINLCPNQSCLQSRCPQEYAMCFSGQAFAPSGCPNGAGGCPGGCPSGGCPNGGCPNNAGAGACPGGGCPGGGCPGGGCPNNAGAGSCPGGACPNQPGNIGACPNPTGAGGAQCAEIIGCFSRCAGEAACADQCYRNGTEQGRGQVDAIYACADAHGCRDFGCIEARCAGAINACF